MGPTLGYRMGWGGRVIAQMMEMSCYNEMTRALTVITMVTNLELS